MPMKKKEDVPQGKNELTITIEKIMQVLLILMKILWKLLINLKINIEILMF